MLQDFQRQILTPGIADLIPLRAQALWSVDERLTKSYRGPLFRVRRASDSAELNIFPYANRRVNLSQLAAFCSGTNGFVKTVYDQSGNAQDVTNTTTGQQPKIYDSSTGALKNGSNLYMQFDGTDDRLTRSDNCGMTGDVAFSVALLGNWASSGNANPFFFQWGSGTNSRACVYYNRSNNRIPIDYASDDRTFTDSNPGTYRQMIAQRAAGDQVGATILRKNSSALTQNSSANPTIVPSFAGAQTAFGGFSGDAAQFQFDGKITTIALYKAKLAAPNLTMLETYLEARRVA